MEFEQMVKLIETVSKSSITKFTLKEGNLELELESDPCKNAVRIERPQAASVYVSQIAEPIAASSGNLSATDLALGGKVVKSPLVGTFYNASSPDADLFVRVGDIVKKGQVLGIVEAMKLMNEIESEFDGVVEEIYVENNQMVEYDQPLFRIG